MCTKQVKALWPKTADPYMHIIVQGQTSKNLQYRASSNNKDEIVKNVLLKMGEDVSRNYNNTDSVIIANTV